MEKNMKSFVLLLAISLNLLAVDIGQVPKEVVLSGDNGGLAKDGSAWSSSSIKDKINVLAYVDPDEKDVNSLFFNILDSKDFNSTLVGRIAIVNLAATWKPNYVIEKILESKQKETPSTVYVKDKKSILVKEWNLADNASNILIFSKKGELLFYKSGKLSIDEIDRAIRLIENSLE